MRFLERRRIRAALLVSAAVLAPAVAFAQEGAGTIEEVVVTARKRAENLQEIPVAVTAVSGESIKAQSIESIREVANQTPSLAISQGSAGRASVVVTIRGQTNNDLLICWESQLLLDLTLTLRFQRTFTVISDLVNRAVVLRA